MTGRAEIRANARSERFTPRNGTRLNSSVHQEGEKKKEGETSSYRQGSQLNNDFRDFLDLGLPRGWNLKLDDEFNRGSADYERLERTIGLRDALTTQETWGKIVLDWKITFDGSCKISAQDLLTRIEDPARLTKVSDEELLLVMPVLLEGLVFKWFKKHELKFAN